MAGLIAAAIEGSRAVSGRIELDRSRQFRVADLSTLLAIVAGATFVVTSGFPKAVVLFFHWLPVVLLPLALMQDWGTQREIALQVLFWSMRRVKLREPATVNLGYPYLVLWLLAASAAAARGPAFDAGLALLVAWALWPLRPDKRRVGERAPDIVGTSLPQAAGSPCVIAEGGWRKGSSSVSLLAQRRKGRHEPLR